MKNPNQKIKNQYVIIHNKNQNKNFYNMISPNKIKKIKPNKTENNLIKDYFIDKNINKKIIKDYPKQKEFNNIYYSSENENKNYEEEYNYENESGTERLHQIKDNYIEYLQKQLDENNKNLIKYEKKINEFSKRYKNLIEDNKLLNETLNERTSKLNEIIQENENLRIQINNNIENENQIKIYYDKKNKEYEDKINECNKIINNLKETKKENNTLNKEMNSPDTNINNNKNNEEELNLLKSQNLIYLNNLKSKDNTIELITKENEKLLKENKEYRAQIEQYTQKMENLYSTIKQKNNIINILKNKEGILETENISENENKKTEGLKICYSQENIYFLSKPINNNKEKEISLEEGNANKNNNNNEKINQSIDKLIFDNEENKMKIEMLNNKLKSFDNFEKKYFEFIKNKNEENNNNNNINQKDNSNNEKNLRYLNLINDNKNDEDKSGNNDYKFDEKEENINIDEENEKDLFNDISYNEGNENLDLKSYKRYKAKDNKERDELKLKKENDEKETKKNEERDNKIKEEKKEKKEEEKEEKKVEEKTKKEEEKKEIKEEKKEEKKEVKKEPVNYRYSFMYRRRLMKEKAEKEKKEKEEKEREEKEKLEKEKLEKEKEEKSKENEDKLKEEKNEIKKHGMKENLKDEKYEIKETVREMNRKRNYTHNPKSKKRFKISDELDVTEINTSSPVVPQNLSFSLNDKNNNNSENIYLFGIDRNDLLHIFDVRKRRWSKKKILEIEDISDTFQKDYQYEGTILYNTLYGLFILTGQKLDILYYYNAQNETINKICKFNNSHDNGSLMLEKEYNRLFVFGGKNTLSCEYYSFIDKKVISIPELNKERANASFVSCNDKIYAFFGFSYEKNNYSESIEYIDNKKLDKWIELKDINILNKEITFDVESVSTFKDKNDNNRIIIYAGIKGENEDFITDSYYIFDTKENSIDLINKWDTKMLRFTGTRWRNYTLSKRDPTGFHFAKNSNFLEIPKNFEIDGYENELNILIDYKNNVHFINQEKKLVDIFKGDI